MCVLVAEDQTEMRAMMSELLRRRGFEVVEAQDGQQLINRLRERLEQASATPPRLIITDVRMPGCSGLEVLTRLRRFDWVTPVILITAFPEEAVVREALRLGASLVLDKPFDLEDLVAAAERLTREH